MTKTINFISLFILSMLLALPPAYAASHSDTEKTADTTPETATESAKTAKEEGEKKTAEGEEEEEPDCD